MIVMTAGNESGSVRLSIHVRPGASRTAVGGDHDGALVVRVVEPAERGRATDAALCALAAALGIPRRAVTLERGATNRNKVVDIAVNGGCRWLDEAVERLRSMPSGRPR